MIGTGAMSDPYLHLEKDLRLTRRCLELVDEYGYGLSIQTKSDMILRDLDILGILEECKKAEVYGIITFGIGVTLRDGDRQYFYQKLDQHFPGMKERYIATYGNAYELPVPHERELMRLVRQECMEAGIKWRTDELFEYMRRYEDKEAGEQLTLFN